MILTTIKVFLLKLGLALITLYPQNSLSIGYNDSPVTFLPHETQTEGEKIISGMVFRKLFKFEDGTLKPDLISTWQISENKTLYSMELKENQYWQDGEKITTDDIIYTLALNRNLIEEIDIERLSDTRFSIKLPTPNAILPSLLTFGVEPEHLQGQSKLQPIGSSSFHIARISTENNEVKQVYLHSFEKEKKYNKVIFRFYPKEEDLKTAYKLGEVDAFLSGSDFSWQGTKAQLITYYGRYFTLIFNLEKAKLQDLQTRQTLINSLNIQGLLERSYYITSKRAFGPISRSEYTKPTFFQDTYVASAALTPAQISDIVDINILLPNNQEGRQMETFLKSEWENKLGLIVKPEYAEPGQILDAAKAGNFDVLFIGHEVSPDPDRYSYWHSTQSKSLNLGKFEDLRADKSLEEGRNFSDFNERQQHYNIFQDVIETKLPAVFLYHPGSYLYTSENKIIPLPARIYNPSEILNNL